MQRKGSEKSAKIPEEAWLTCLLLVDYQAATSREC
jgi:hypothetical protein